MAKPKKPLPVEKRHDLAVRKLGYTTDEYYTKRGRKSLFRVAMIEEVKKLAGLGLIIDEIAVFWRLGSRTVKRYAQNKPEFRHALKEGRLIADKNVEDSLYKRAVGFASTERHYEIEYETDDAGVVKAMRKLKKEIVKQIAGDTTAIIFHLKNRRPDKWRDDRGLSLFGPEGEPVTVQYIPASEYFKDKKAEQKPEDGDGKGGDGQDSPDPTLDVPVGTPGSQGEGV